MSSEDLRSHVSYWRLLISTQPSGKVRNDVVDNSTDNSSNYLGDYAPRKRRRGTFAGARVDAIAGVSGGSELQYYTSIGRNGPRR